MAVGIAFILLQFLVKCGFNGGILNFSHNLYFIDISLKSVQYIRKKRFTSTLMDDEVILTVVFCESR